MYKYNTSKRKNRVNRPSDSAITNHAMPTNALSQEKNAYSGNNPASSNHILSNHDSDEYYLVKKANHIQQLIDGYAIDFSYDSDGFQRITLPLVGDDPDLQDIYFEYTNFIDSNPHASTNELHQVLTESLRRYE